MPKPNVVNAAQSEVVSCEGAKTTNWHAWINKMPPKPDDLHVTGQVEVPNLGVVAELIYRVPQGINEKYLLLDLVLIQKPGFWPQIPTLATARYDQTPPMAEYESVEVFCGTNSVATMKVEVVH